MEKIPCIKYNPKNWEYIKQTLESFGYVQYKLDRWDECPYIVINLGNRLGLYSNVKGTAIRDTYDRVIIDNEEEFLERAAKLKGKTYKRNDVMEINGVEIKPGMVFVTNPEDENDIFIVFPTKDGLSVVGYFTSYFNPLKSFYRDYKDNIIEIHDLSDGHSITGGKILWEKSKEYTMQEIADKLGIPVEQLRIKK